MKLNARNIIAIVTGIVVGGIVNMVLIMISGSIIPPPPGADMVTMEGLQESMHLFEPKHFLMPFLAHALGTLVGGVVTALIAVESRLRLCITVGVFFLLGGIANVVALPSPIWFNIVDLTGAYIPMAYLGFLIADKIKKEDQ